MIVLPIQQFAHQLWHKEAKDKKTVEHQHTFIFLHSMRMLNDDN